MSMKDELRLLLEDREYNLYRGYFRCFNRFKKSDYKFVFDGRKEGYKFFKSRLRSFGDFKLVVVQAYIQAKINDKKDMVFELVHQLEGRGYTSIIIGKVTKKGDIYKFVPYDEEKFEEKYITYKTL